MRGVSDRYDGHAGRTIVGMTVCHVCPLKDTWKKMRDPWKKGLCLASRLCRTDRRGYDGPSRVFVEGHLGKNERPLEKGSLSSMTVMQDGPSRGRRSITCVQ